MVCQKCGNLLDLNKHINNFNGIFQLVECNNGCLDYEGFYAITVQSAKKHLNIELDFVDDDDLIVGYIYSAYNYVAKYIGFKPDFGNSTNGVNTDNYSIGIAILMLVGHFYEQRSTLIDSNSKINFALKSILDMHKINWL